LDKKIADLAFKAGPAVKPLGPDIVSLNFQMTGADIMAAALLLGKLNGLIEPIVNTTFT
jgi:hypothetical protein